MGKKSKLSESLINLIKEEAKKELKRQANIMKQEAMAELNEVLDKCNIQTTNSLYEEAVNMYDSLIEQYYRYKTKSYYRHNAGVGTCWGDNLYYAQDFMVDTNLDLHIQYDPNKMERYIPKYIEQKKGVTTAELDSAERVSRETVLNIVKSGFRGVPGKWIIPWSGSYAGEYFSINDTNIDRAFKLFIDQYENMYDILLRQNYKREVSKGRYKYL